VSVKAEEKTEDDGKGTLSKTAAEVLAMATAEGVHFKTFEAEAKKLLGEKTPSGKRRSSRLSKSWPPSPD
jgi:hypothetical protein